MNYNVSACINDMALPDVLPVAAAKIR